MARKLRDRGFDVVNYNASGYNGGPYVKLGKGFPSALTHLLLRTDHDVYFTGLSFTPSISLYLNRRLRKKPYVFNMTGADWQAFDDRSKGKPFAGVFEKRIYPSLQECVFAGASRIVCNSRFLESAIAAHYPQYRDRLMTIYNGIESDQYSAGRRQPLPGIPEGATVLLYVTTLNYINKSRGLELIIDAFGQVVAERKDARLVIAAKTSHPRYAEWGQQYVRTKPWRDAVSFLFNYRNIPDLLASSDLFVYATPNNSNDSLPRALLEAQSAGLPVVTTDTTGCPEIVRDGITGFVVPYDANPLACRILELMGNARLRKAMGREAQQWISHTFNWDQMADQYAEVFRAVLS
jgi:glycosyltransferase involved in cell wall biosynthesis